MPESAEVTLMAEELNREFDDCLLRKVHLHSGRYKKNVPKHYRMLQLALPLKIKHIGNRGKFVFIELDQGWALGITPGMTGHFWTPEVSGAFRTMEGYTYNPKHNHVEFVTTCGSFFLNDPRMFGHLYVYSPKEKADTLRKKLQSLGPDLLQDLPKIKQPQFNEMFLRYKKGKVIADALLDQKFVAGVGNYIRAEALYRAKIAPLRKISSLTAAEKKRLKTELQKVGKESYKCQKSKGLHRFKFMIYRKPHAKQIKRQGRTIWWDPKKQK
jgi:formamidopyrimidine-DNA glycosylase